jgi:hypothetical protein
MSEHRGHLIEGDTKTHGASVVQVPALVLEELRAHLDAHVELTAEAPIFTTLFDAAHGGEPHGPKRGASSSAAALGHDPAVFLRTYAYLYPSDLKAVADALDMVRIAACESATGMEPAEADH